MDDAWVRGRVEVMHKAQLWLFLPKHCSALMITAAMKAFGGWNPYVRSCHFSVSFKCLWQTFIPQESRDFSSSFSSPYSPPLPPNSKQNSRLIKGGKKKQQNVSSNSTSLVIVCSGRSDVTLSVLLIWSYFSLYYITLSAHLVEIRLILGANCCSDMKFVAHTAKCMISVFARIT